MRKLSGHGESTGLLDPERADDASRPNLYAETADISDPEGAERDRGEPFLRARERVPVRRRGRSRFLRRFGWKSRWARAMVALIAVAILGLLVAAAWGARSLLLRNPRFMLASAADVQVSGNRVVTSQQVLAVFAPDLGRSIFRVPLAQRQGELEQIRWVRRAMVMRLWPDRLRVQVLERTPIAFARDGNSIRLVDAEGVLLDLPDAAAQHYSFPVVSGIASSDPLATRAERMALYQRFVQALDAGGEKISATLSEVDLTDPQDVRAVFSGDAPQPLVHFGVSDFLPRYQAYRAHLAEWRQRYPQLRSVDMRYGRQVVLDTGTATAPPATPRVLNESVAAAGAGTPGASSSSGTTAGSKTHAVKSTTKSAPRKKPAAARHRGHSRGHTRAPERGHPVTHPLMHVVSGM